MSTDPGGLDLPEDLEVWGEDAARRGTAWLADVWRREEVRAALWQASPALSQQIAALGTHGSRDGRPVRRAAAALASYLLRWQRRPTPFGLFAGVSAARVGTDAKARWGGGHRVALRADASWLGDILTRLQQCPQLRDRLSVVANDAGRVRGTRFVAPGPPPGGSGQALAPVEVSVRHSRPVRAALEAARRPVRFGELRALLGRRFPAAAGRQIDALLAGLLEEQILVSALWAPMTCPDALGHACAELAAVGADTIAEVGGLVAELTLIHQELSTTGPTTVSRSDVANRMRALSTAAEVPLVADTVVDCDVELPAQVARDACDAVGVLFRLSPYQLGYPSWRDYHDRFRARYGLGALVPVLELVADSGLGYPAGYLDSASGRGARQVSERDQQLLALVQRAMADGSGEIVLTDQIIAELVPSDPADVQLPARAEIAVEVQAESVEALRRGRFMLTVTGTPRPGSSMAGRHAAVLAAADRESLAHTYAATEPGAVVAQLSFVPRKRRNENIARTAQLLPQVIPLAEHRGPEKSLISLADLAVTVDERRFYLIQRSTGRRIEPRVTHALEAGAQTPPLARFLAEITTARCAVYKAFDFGVAARLPHLPRVRYRRTVLSPARWLLDTGDLPGRGASMADWDAGLRAWQARWKAPEHVAIVDHDRRQPVDLEHPAHRLLLRRRLDRAGQVELRETASPRNLAWLGRAHEILLPVVRDVSAVAVPTPLVGVSEKSADQAGRHLPGKSTILCAQIYGHPGRFEEILTEHVPGLLATMGATAPRWWFRRHRQMRHPEIEQYLALYLHLSEPSVYGPAAEQVAAWANRLHQDRLLSRLALVTYQPQTGRYGHGPAMQRAHDAFAADSAAAIAQITMATRTGTDPHVLAAASLVDLVVSFTASPQVGLDWLVHELPQQHGRLEPALRDQTLALADVDGEWTALRSLPGGTEVIAAWRARATALTAYREQLAAQRDPTTVLCSLLHLHLMRALGVDPDRERVITRLARACALRHTACRTEA